MPIVVRLQELMQTRGIGYVQVARGTGLPLRTLYDARTGRHWPSKATAEALCRYFEVAPGELFAWEPEPNRPRPPVAPPPLHPRLPPGR